MNRTERLYAITEYLRRRRTAVTVADLAARFEVGERTIHRDLATLREQNVPIEGEPGRGGGLRLGAGYSMPPLGLSVDEAVGLWLSYRLGSLLGPVPVGHTLGSALDKVFGALPDGRRRLLEAILARIIVGRPARPGLADTASPLDPEVFRRCEQAFLQGCQLRMAYVDRHGQASERSVEPHGLLVQAPLWYVLAVDPWREGPRMFRMDRITRAFLEEGKRFVPRDPRALFTEIVALGIEVSE